MEAALIAVAALGIWLGIEWRRNAAAREDVGKRAEAASKPRKGRWTELRKTIRVAAVLSAVILLVVVTRDQAGMVWHPTVSYAAFAVSLWAVTVGTWLVHRYRETSRVWKAFREAKDALHKAKRLRWETLEKLIGAAAVLVAILYIAIRSA
jgi:hypothetical protein